MTNLFTSEDSKKFWSYIRSRKKDNVGIQTLKVGNQTITDDQTKADTLAKQFKDVFTHEDPILPDLPSSPFPDMPEIDVTVEGVEKLLCTLKTNKAIGPDGIPNAALKMAAHELAPALQFIFKQSLDRSELPEDLQKRFQSRSCKLPSHLFDMCVLQAARAHCGQPTDEVYHKAPDPFRCSARLQKIKIM